MAKKVAFNRSGAETRLAVYGTLAPGRKNHHQLAGLKGRWINGTVRGHLHQKGWGAAFGFPGLVLDANAPEVDVQVLQSPYLPTNWPRLDAFEGPGYQRVEVSVETSMGPLTAFLYEIIA